MRTRPSGDSEEQKDAASHKEAPEQQPQGEEREDPTEQLRALKDRYLRLAAEFDNYRKRTQREKDELLKYGTEQILLQLLPFDEIFENIIGTLEQGRAEDDPIRRGLEILKEEFSRLLASLGLTRIEAVHQQFDPRLHEAVATVETSEVPEGTIVEEQRPGYRFHDRILRPAAVKVARPPHASNEVPPEDAGQGESGA